MSVADPVFYLQSLDTVKFHFVVCDTDAFKLFGVPGYHGIPLPNDLPAFFKVNQQARCSVRRPAVERFNLERPQPVMLARCMRLVAAKLCVPSVRIAPVGIAPTVTPSTSEPSVSVKPATTADRRIALPW